ncbi:hypothetical protein BC936DRAFT_147405, partial [Jimgerdemannia flammicorona]
SHRVLCSPPRAQVHQVRDREISTISPTRSDTTTAINTEVEEESTKSYPPPKKKNYIIFRPLVPQCAFWEQPDGHVPTNSTIHPRPAHYGRSVVSQFEWKRSSGSPGSTPWRATHRSSRGSLLLSAIGGTGSTDPQPRPYYRQTCSPAQRNALPPDAVAHAADPLPSREISIYGAVTPSYTSAWKIQKAATPPCVTTSR